jgi:hypothetical protein
MRRVLVSFLLTISLLTCALATQDPLPRSAAMQSQAGDPNIRVWIDRASGFYHCPGSKGYGATSKGAYMTQKQAQDGGYRPAYGWVCR